MTRTTKPKQLLAALLSAILLLTLLPTAALATDPVQATAKVTKITSGDGGSLVTLGEWVEDGDLYEWSSTGSFLAAKVYPSGNKDGAYHYEVALLCPFEDADLSITYDNAISEGTGYTLDTAKTTATLTDPISAGNVTINGETWNIYQTTRMEWEITGLNKTAGDKVERIWHDKNYHYYREHTADYNSASLADAGAGYKQTLLATAGSERKVDVVYTLNGQPAAAERFAKQTQTVSKAYTDGSPPTLTDASKMLEGGTVEMAAGENWKITVTFSAAEPDFVAVTDITDVPTTAVAGTDLALSGTIAPEDATAKNTPIVWTVKTAGDTGATIAEGTSVLKTTAAGTVVVTATVEKGASTTTSFTKDYTIEVSAAGGGTAPEPDTAPVLTSLTVWGVPVTLAAPTGTSPNFTATGEVEIPFFVYGEESLNDLEVADLKGLAAEGTKVGTASLNDKKWEIKVTAGADTSLVTTTYTITVVLAEAPEQGATENEAAKDILNNLPTNDEGDAAVINPDDTAAVGAAIKAINALGDAETVQDLIDNGKLTDATLKALDDAAEKGVGGVSNAIVVSKTPETAVTDLFDSAPTVNVVGAALNAGASDKTVKLVVDVLKTQDVPASLNTDVTTNKLDSTTAVELNISLTSGVSNTPVTTLKVPLTITLPIPSNIDINKPIVILHYPKDKPVEAIPTDKIAVDKSLKTMTFTVTSLSPVIVYNTTRAATTAANMLTQVEIGDAKMVSDTTTSGEGKFAPVPRAGSATMAAYGTGADFWVGNYSFEGSAYDSNSSGVVGFYEILVATWGKNIVLTFAEDVNLQNDPNKPSSVKTATTPTGTQTAVTSFTAVNNVLTLTAPTPGYYWVTINGTTFFIVPTSIVKITVTGLTGTEEVGFDFTSAIGNGSSSYAATATKPTIYVTVDPGEKMEIDMTQVADTDGITFEGLPPPEPDGTYVFTGTGSYESVQAVEPAAPKLVADPTRIDFPGVTSTTNDSTPITVTLSNDGNVVLEDLTAVLKGLDDDAFSISTPIPGSTDLALNASNVTFVVDTDDNLALGTYTAIVEVDADQLAAPIEIPVTFTVTTANDATLVSLTPTPGTGTLTPAFAKDTLAYTMSVANNVTSIALTPVATLGGSAKVALDGTGAVIPNGNAYTLSMPTPGSYTVEFVVTAGTDTKTYKVTVTRAAASSGSGGSSSGSSGSNGSWPGDNYPPAPPPPAEVLPGTPGSSSPTTPSVTNPFSFRVLARSLNVRSGPGTSFAKVGTLRANDVVSVIGYSADGLWAQTQAGSWVSMAYVSQVASVDVGDYIVTVRSGSLNVRSGPGTSSAKIGSLTNNALVMVNSVTNGWAQIEYNGGVGYVSVLYLR